MIAPEGEPPIRIRDRNIVKLIGRTKGRLLGKLDGGEGVEGSDGGGRRRRKEEAARGGGAWERANGRDFEERSGKHVKLDSCCHFGKDGMVLVLCPNS